MEENHSLGFVQSFELLNLLYIEHLGWESNNQITYIYIYIYAHTCAHTHMGLKDINTVCCNEPLPTTSLLTLTSVIYSITYRTPGCHSWLMTGPQQGQCILLDLWGGTCVYSFTPATSHYLLLCVCLPPALCRFCGCFVFADFFLRTNNILYEREYKNVTVKGLKPCDDTGRIKTSDACFC